jgi:hypothetical protein
LCAVVVTRTAITWPSIAVSLGARNCRVLTAVEMSMLIWAATPCGFVGRSIPPHSSMLNVESERPVLMFLYQYQQRPDSASDVWQEEHFQFLKPEQAQSLEIGPPWLAKPTDWPSRVVSIQQSIDRDTNGVINHCGHVGPTETRLAQWAGAPPVTAQRVSKPRRWTLLLHVWQSFWTAPRARGVTYVQYSQCQAVSLHQTSPLVKKCEAYEITIPSVCPPPQQFQNKSLDSYEIQ